jgi:hypothetical protein
MIVRSITAHRHVKNLCRFFGSTSNTIKVIDSETIAIVSGKFSGLTFAFELGLCQVTTGNWSTCFDMNGDFSADALMSVLVKHSIIRPGDLEG